MMTGEPGARCYMTTIKIQLNPSIEAIIGEGNLAFIEGCPYLRGIFEPRKILWDITVLSYTEPIG